MAAGRWASAWPAPAVVRVRFRHRQPAVAFLACVHVEAMPPPVAIDRQRHAWWRVPAQASRQPYRPRTYPCGATWGLLGSCRTAGASPAPCCAAGAGLRFGGRRLFPRGTVGGFGRHYPVRIRRRLCSLAGSAAATASDPTAGAPSVWRCVGLLTFHTELLQDFDGYSGLDAPRAAAYDPTAWPCRKAGRPMLVSPQMSPHWVFRSGVLHGWRGLEVVCLVPGSAPSKSRLAAMRAFLVSGAG